MKITLPFPSKDLSPNSRKHWGAKIKAKNSLKEAGVVEGYQNRRLASPDASYCVSVAFYPPNLRWDVDGMFSALKSGIDGLAIGMKINDRQFRKFILEVPDSDKLNPRVEIEITEIGLK